MKRTIKIKLVASGTYHVDEKFIVTVETSYGKVTNEFTGQSIDSIQFELALLLEKIVPSFDDFSTLFPLVAQHYNEDFSKNEPDCQCYTIAQ